MIKLIASDLDGTLLLNGAQSMEPRIFDQIKRLREKGILFVASSGRQYANLRRLFAPVCDDIAYICENGCLSFYQGKKIYKATMEREVGQKLIRAILEKESAEVLLSGEETCYMQPKQEAFYEHVKYVVKNDVTRVDDIFSVREDYFKISIYDREDYADSKKMWQEQFGKELSVVDSGIIWLDCTPKGVNKGVSMKKLQEYLGIAPDECMAFGDNYNDIEMLKNVKYNFVMENAPEDIKKTSKYITARVEDTLDRLLNEGENWL